MSEIYKELVEKLIPEEEPEPDERKAIEEDDELVSEEELLKKEFEEMKKGPTPLKSTFS